MAHATGLLLCPSCVGGTARTSPDDVSISKVLMTPASWPGRISRSAGVKAQDDSLGRPEQETVMNDGAPVVFKEATNSWDGVTVTVAVPDWPGVSVIAEEVDGAIFETEIANAVVHCELIAADAGMDVEGP
jgi:hypothetical protein